MFYVFYLQINVFNIHVSDLTQNIMDTKFLVSYVFFIFSFSPSRKLLCLKFYFYFSISITFYDSLKMWDLILVKEHNDGRWHKQ